MGCRIEISNISVDGDANFMNNMSIDDDNTDIIVKGVNVKGSLEMLNDLEIRLMMASLEDRVLSMEKNSEEYRYIKKILNEEQWNVGKFCKCIGKHLAQFSEGVLASVIANFLML